MVSTRSQQSKYCLRSRNILRDTTPIKDDQKKISKKRKTDSLYINVKQEKQEKQDQEKQEEEETMSICSEDSEIESLDDLVLTYETLIDFDDAHNGWIENKRKLPNGCYVYICGKILKNGKKCQRSCCDKIGLYSGCRTHYMWEEKKHKHQF